MTDLYAGQEWFTSVAVGAVSLSLLWAMIRALFAVIGGRRAP